MDTDEFNAEGNPAMHWYPVKGSGSVSLVASSYRNRVKLRSDEPHGGSNPECTFSP